MKPLHGPISDRLRRLFKPGDPAWTPQRPPKEHRDIPRTATGHSFGRGPDPQGNDLTED